MFTYEFGEGKRQWSIKGSKKEKQHGPMMTRMCWPQPSIWRSPFTPFPHPEKKVDSSCWRRKKTLGLPWCKHAAAAKSLQSCPTLCDPIDGSPPGSLIPGILQTSTLEWVAISFSNAWKWKVKGKSLSHVRLLATPWTAAYQAPPSMGFSRQEYWSGMP